MFPVTRLPRKAEISVDQVRNELTKAIQQLPDHSKAVAHLRRMRQACRDFLETIEADINWSSFEPARRNLQETFAREVKALSVEYSINLSPELDDFVSWWEKGG
jgi:hypothetical protein